MPFRKALFWIHLAAGLVAGISIGVMCFTGVMLAFEKQLVAWAERDARLVPLPEGDATRLSIDELLNRFRESHPGVTPGTITVQSSPDAAVAFAIGREEVYYLNPYTGEARQPESSRMHDFMDVMTAWHRTLAMSGENRATGKAINGACNLAFFFLALSGLYIWWPRRLSWRSLKALAVFNWRLTGKARDFNWHNSIGLWSAPVLIVLTLTAVPISYRWGGNLIYRIAGEQPPAQQRRGEVNTPVVDMPDLAPEARPLSTGALFSAVQQAVPEWGQISLRIATAGGPRAAGQPGGSPSPRDGSDRQGASGDRPAREAPGASRNPDRTASASSGRSASAPAVSFTVRIPGTWPRTASTTVLLNPFTGDVIRREGFSELTTARQIRSWTRFLHTGEALGWAGQLVAGLACLGGCFLVYTGFALSWRRFFGKRREPALVTASTDADALADATSRR